MIGTTERTDIIVYKLTEKRVAVAAAVVEGKEEVEEEEERRKVIQVALNN